MEKPTKKMSVPFKSGLRFCHHDATGEPAVPTLSVGGTAPEKLAGAAAPLPDDIASDGAGAAISKTGNFVLHLMHTSVPSGLGVPHSVQ